MSSALPPCWSVWGYPSPAGLWLSSLSSVSLHHGEPGSLLQLATRLVIPPCVSIMLVLKPGVLVGFDSLSRSYKIYSLLTKRLRRSSGVVFCESTFPLNDPAQQVASQLDDEFALDLLAMVHGQRVGGAPVDLAQEHSHSDVSASPTSPSVSPSVHPGASSSSGSASPSPSPGP